MVVLFLTFLRKLHTVFYPWNTAHPTPPRRYHSTAGHSPCPTRSLWLVQGWPWDSRQEMSESLPGVCYLYTWEESSCYSGGKGPRTAIWCCPQPTLPLEKMKPTQREKWQWNEEERKTLPQTHTRTHTYTHAQMHAHPHAKGLRSFNPGIIEVRPFLLISKISQLLILSFWLNLALSFANQRNLTSISHRHIFAEW